MTIFHAIKFADVEIDNDDQLNALPAEVVSAWHNRMIDYAVEQALTCVHLDVTGAAQQCIDAIADYRAGKITKEELWGIASTGHGVWSRDHTAAAIGSSIYAADSVCVRGTCVIDVSCAMYYSRKALGMSPDWYQVEAEHKILFKKWLVEELMMFDMV